MYLIPSSKSELLYDFYLLQMLYGVPNRHYRALNRRGIMVQQPRSDFRDMNRDEMIDYELDCVAKDLLSHLREDLLNELHFAICCEFRHSFGKTLGWDDEPIERCVTFMDRFKVTVEDFESCCLTYHNPGQEELRKHRLASFDAVSNIQSSQFDFVCIARELFLNQVWIPEYGGSAWVRIADAWLSLHKASRASDVMIQIDHIFDLQHNTGNVLDKSLNYGSDNPLHCTPFLWLSFFLDHKASVSSPMDLWQYASSSMKRIALPAIFAKYGETLENYRVNTNHVNKKMFDDYRTLYLSLGSKRRAISRVFVNNLSDADIDSLVTYPKFSQLILKCGNTFKEEFEKLIVVDTEIYNDVINYGFHGEIVSRYDFRKSTQWDSIKSRSKVHLSELTLPGLSLNRDYNLNALREFRFGHGMGKLISMTLFNRKDLFDLVTILSNVLMHYEANYILNHC